MIDREESLRLHLDWWAQCRTCRFWTGDRSDNLPGSCGNDRSELHGKETWNEGYCPQWDTFDEDVAFYVLENDL